MVKDCGVRFVPGTKVKIYAIPKDEITTYPAVLGTTALGDKKKLDGAFVLSTTAGKGYWREFEIIVDTGDFKLLIEGELGGEMIKQRFTGFVPGMGAAQAEFADNMVCNSGCLILLIPTKSGDYIVMGTLEDPVYIEPGEGGTGGTRAGMTYNFYANTGVAPYYYDATEGIDTTPSV